EAEIALNRSRTGDEYRAVLESSLEECDHLAKLIDNLLFLARAEHPETTIQRETTDVGQELAAIRDFYEATAADGGVVLTVSAPDQLALGVDRSLFQRALGNLLSNALAHTPAGGSILVSAASTNDSVEVAVKDTGEGIAAEHLPHVFDRFYRA